MRLKINVKFISSVFKIDIKVGKRILDLSKKNNRINRDKKI